MDIASFYANKYVLLTGGTGFLGKTVLEKLLRSCPDVAGVYVLARSSKDNTAVQRVEELVQGELFDTLRLQNPNFEDKVIAIPAEITKPGLNLTPEHRQLLSQTVSVYIHCAATVNFNEKLDISLANNVESVCHLLALARESPNLSAFVHVSTAYSQCDKSHIQEKFYPPVADPKSLIDAVHSMTPEAIAAITKPLVGKRPNTYTLTKSLAEEMVRIEGKGLPVAVVRPSIVGGIADSGPLPGWSDNLNGPSGIYLAVAHNILRVMPGDNDAILDLVPVDYCANMIIAVGWRLGKDRPHIVNPEADPLVYNCTSGGANPILMGVHNDIVLQQIIRSPVVKPGFIRKPSFTMYKDRFYFDKIWDPICHQVPAAVVDFSRQCIGKKPFMKRLYSKLGNSIAAYAYFCSGCWKWDYNNCKNMNMEMSEEDRKNFNFDFSKVTWKEYLVSYYEGCKKFVKKEEAPSKMANNTSSTTTSTAVTQKSSSLPMTIFASTLLVILVAALFTFIFDTIIESVDPSSNQSNSSLNTTVQTVASNVASSIASVASSVVTSGNDNLFSSNSD